MPLARMSIVHDEDPRKVIWREVGDLGGIEPLYQGVLVAIYVRPATRTPGGIEIPETVVDEDRFQAKAGMVLKVGRRAFVDDGPLQFHGFRVEPGDWVVYRPSDGLKMQIGSRECRLIPDVHLKMTITHPDLVY
jgi:co-chaperonin GroES (HSP10)